MARMPGAVWRPIPLSATRPKRRTGRGVCLHVAVSESASLFGYFSTADVDSHFYVAKDGTIEQYVDTDLVAYAQIDGNSTLISVETQGGVTNAEGEPWTPEQVASLARICRWAHDTEGVPLQLMTSSLSTSRGIGYHRLGVNPWRTPGGEVWSTAYGKTCPGAAKVAQIPGIVAAAAGGASTTPGGFLMALSDAQQTDLYNWMKSIAVWIDWFGTPDDDPATPENESSPNSKGELTKRIRQTHLMVTALAARQPDQVDPTQLAEAITSAMGSNFAQQVIDALGERIGTGKTPPTAA